MIQHIGFIMDGNRRYAKKNSISLKEAYKNGMEQFLEAISFQIENDISHTSFFALSTHNQKKRKQEELEPIGELIEEFFEQKNIENFFVNNKILLHLRGNLEGLKQNSTNIQFKKKRFIENLEEKFEEYKLKIPRPLFHVHIALNYDGQEEILHSLKEIIHSNNKNPTLQDIKQHLYFADVPAPDIIVRPGNAPRLSGFMLFDSEYSECYFTKKLWPELQKEDFNEILNWFKNIKRNFGQ